MPDHNRLAAEMLAVADALRTIRGSLARAVHTDHPAVTGRPEVRTVLVEGLDVAAALEALAQRIATEA